MNQPSILNYPPEARTSTAKTGHPQRKINDHGEDMMPIARLSMCCLNTQTADAKRLYEQAFWPLLKSQGLKAGMGEAPSMPTGVFSQLFEVESPQQVSTIKQVLSQHPQWQEAQRAMTPGRSSPMANPEVQSRFELYEMAAAAGEPLELSPIIHQG